MKLQDQRYTQYVQRHYISICKKQYGTIPEYLWNDLPDSAILRNDNGKWYAVFMNLEGFKIGLIQKIGLILWL